MPSKDFDNTKHCKPFYLIQKHIWLWLANPLETLTNPFWTLQKFWHASAGRLFNVKQKQESHDDNYHNNNYDPSVWLCEVLLDFNLKIKNFPNNIKNVHFSIYTSNINKTLQPMPMSIKSWWWCCINKLWCHYHFSDLWLIWSNLESRFQMHDLWMILTFSSIPTLKTENRAELKNNKKSLTQLSCYCFKVLFLPKIQIFAKKNADISKLKRVLVLKGVFSETAYLCLLIRVYLYTKFQVSSIILMSFRQWVILTLHLIAKRTPQKPKQINI